MKFSTLHFNQEGKFYQVVNVYTGAIEDHTILLTTLDLNEATDRAELEWKRTTQNDKKRNYVEVREYQKKWMFDVDEDEDYCEFSGYNTPVVFSLEEDLKKKEIKREFDYKYGKRKQLTISFYQKDLELYEFCKNEINFQGVVKEYVKKLFEESKNK